MAILPDKIIQDYEFDAFINRVNSGAEKIISDSKFKLTTPDLPGLSFLIKLQVRVFEKALASSFAPIFIGKNAFSNGIKGIREAFESLQTLFSNPLQFLLDEGVNSTLEDFPFPLRLELGGASSGSLDLPLSDARDFSGYQTFDYNPVFNTNDLPEAGQYTTQQSSVDTIQFISISKITNTNNENPLLVGVSPGDPIQISDGVSVGNFTVSTVQDQGQNNSVRLGLKFVSSSLLTDVSAQTSIPGFSSPSIGFEKCQLVIKNFINPEGALKIPISALGLNIPLLENLTFVIGDFSQLKETSPTKKFVDRLSQETGLEFQDVFSGILTGNFPNIDFSKIQEESEAGIDESEEQSKIDLITVARFLEIGITNPCFLIGIILNYVKLLLLPIKVVINVLRGLGELISGPIRLIRTVIKGITDPLGLICDLVAIAFLEVLRPYIQNPLAAANITWQEALEDPNDPSRGLKPLISDMVCGMFRDKLKNFTPSQSFFQNLRNELEDNQVEELGPQITYDLRVDGLIPSEGQVSVNSENPSEIRNFKVSIFSNTVENATSALASLSPGDEFTFSFLDQIGKYRVSTKNFISDSDFPYFEIRVQPIPNLLEIASSKSDSQILVDGLNNDNLRSQLSIDNPDTEFLFILENYLPIKLIGVWEAIKGMIAIFGSLAQQVPSLLPAIVRGLFSNGNNNQSQSEVLALIESGDFDFTSLSIDSSIEVVNLIYGGGSDGQSFSFPQSYVDGLVYQSTDQSDGFSNRFSEESREALFEIVNNSPSFFEEPGIEQIFYDLGDSLSRENKAPVVFRKNLSTDPGRLTDLNPFLNRRRANEELLFRRNAPDKSEFYWGAYNLVDIGNTVKVLTSIMMLFGNQYYFSTSNINLSDRNITVYVNNDTGTGRRILYQGSILNALKKYYFISYPFEERIQYWSLRIYINRQMSLLSNYLLPSLKES